MGVGQKFIYICKTEEKYLEKGTWISKNLYVMKLDFDIAVQDKNSMWLWTAV